MAKPAAIAIASPYLYRQLQTQLRQWVRPQGQSHLPSLAEIVAAIRPSATTASTLTNQRSRLILGRQFNPYKRWDKRW